MIVETPSRAPPCTIINYHSLWTCSNLIVDDSLSCLTMRMIHCTLCFCISWQLMTIRGKMSSQTTIDYRAPFDQRFRQETLLHIVSLHRVYKQGISVQTILIGEPIKKTWSGEGTRWQIFYISNTGISHTFWQFWTSKKLQSRKHMKMMFETPCFKYIKLLHSFILVAYDLTRDYHLLDLINKLIDK